MLTTMPYPKNLLNAGEEVTLDLHPHWAYFLEPVFTVLGIIIVALIIQFTLSGDVQDVLGIASGVGILAAAVWFGIRYLKWRNTNFVLTDDRLIYRSGVFTKHGVQIPLERIMNVNFRQGIFERMVGAGDLLIESGGETGQSRFTDVRQPDQIQKLIHAQIEDNERRKYRLGEYEPERRPAGPSTPLPPPPPADVVGQLEKLEGMLQRGTITQAEFDTEKAKLLGA
jgi:uncharacterized membrane protein YdbT with pleckstrin-like domain